jgi:hypothetical protein
LIVPLDDKAQVEACFGPFANSANLDARWVHGLHRTHHRLGAWFALYVPYAQKLFWTHLIVPLDDKAQVEACFGPFANSDNLDARWVHGLHRTYHRLKNHFGLNRWDS